MVMIASSFQSQNVYLMQKRHPCTGNLGRTRLGTVQTHFYIVEMF